MKKYLCILGLVLIIIVIIVIINILHSNNTLYINNIKNDDKYIIEFSKLNESDSHILELIQGDVLDIEVINNQGKITLEIVQNDEEPIYKSDNLITSTFKVNITKDGTYKIKITGRNAKGKISVIKE